MAGPSNYPGGFSNGVTIRGVPVSIMHPGKVFWVNNSTVLAPGGIGGSDSNDGTYQRPFSTVDYAIGRCTSGRGDVIAVMPGHAETIATAAAILSDVAGVAIVGLGSGASRPTFTWSAVASTWSVTVANTSFVNLNFISSMATTFTTTGFDLAAGADGITFDNCYFADTDSTHGFVTMVTSATGVDNIAFVNCQANQLMVTSGAFFTGVAHDRFLVDNCFLACTADQTTPVGNLTTSGNVTNGRIKDSSFVQLTDAALLIDFNGTANTGTISNCYFSSLDIADAVTIGIDATGMHAFECYVAGEADTYGIIGGGTAYNNA